MLVVAIGVPVIFSCQYSLQKTQIRAVAAKLIVYEIVEGVKEIAPR